MVAEDVKTIAKGAGFFLIGMLISKVLTYFYRIFIARYFGPENYGLFSLSLTVLSFTGLFARMGLHSGVVRYIPYYKGKGDDSRIKGTILYSLASVGISSILIAGLLILFADQISQRIFHDPALTEMLVVMALALPFLSMFYILNFGFQGFKAIRYQVYTEQIFLNTTNLITVLVFGFLGFGAIGIAWSYTISIICTLFFAIYLFQKKVFPFLFSNIKAINTTKELLTYSFPLVLSGVFGGFIISNTDIAMIGYFKDSVEVGTYNAALPTARILGIAAGSLTILFLPIITELYAQGKMHELERVYKITVKWIFFFNFPLLLILLFYPHIIISFLFGKDYSAGSNALFFLSLGIFLVGLSTTHSHILGMLKKTKIIFYITVITASANLPLNWFLIPRIGITGAAIASFLTYCAQYLLLFYFSYRFIKIMPVSYSIIKAIIASISSFIIFYTISQPLLDLGYTKSTLIFLLVGYLGIYSIFLLISRALDEEDIEILRAIERKSGLRIGFLRNFIKKFI
jgi:O-antigen/teichoic acid export membrane protein